MTDSLPAKFSSLGQALNKTLAKPVMPGLEHLFMKFSKGDWMYGPDDVEPSSDVEYGVNPFSFHRGFIAWPTAGGDPLDERMMNISEGEIDQADLPHIDGGRWSPQLSFEMVGLSGDERGLKFKFSTNSVGGLKAVTGLMTSLGEKATSGAEDCVPVLLLGVDSYDHKTYGRVKFPVFEVQEWVTMDVTLDAYEERELGTEPEPEPEPTPPPRSKRNRTREFR